MPFPLPLQQSSKGPALAAADLSKTLEPILAIVGPTATGKTRLALALARKWNGEILSADMGQMYRLLDAGTAKPHGRWRKTGDDRPAFYEVEGVPYHMVDVLDPAEPTDAGTFAAMARPALEGILRRGKRALIAGGTGLYVRALLEGLDPLPPRDLGLRKRLSGLAELRGKAWLHEELKRLDPVSAQRIPPGNVQRVVRALEVLELTGRPFSEQRTRAKNARQDVLYLGLDWEPARLRERIRARAREMFPRMLEETAALVPARYSGQEPGFRCLGYPEALACLRGEMSHDEALEGMIKSTSAYAKRQRTWFKRQAPVRWLDPEANPDDIPLWNA